KAPSYSMVKELDMRPVDKQSLKEFYAEKAPDDQQAQFVVIVYYLTRILGLTGIGTNHIYTALKEVNVKVPANIAQIARNAASRKGWLDTADSEDLKVTTMGENFVEHDLPATAA